MSDFQDHEMKWLNKRYWKEILGYKPVDHPASRMIKEVLFCDQESVNEFVDRMSMDKYRTDFSFLNGIPVNLNGVVPKDCFYIVYMDGKIEIFDII